MAQIRPVTSLDKEQVLALAPRLREGVAEWRDPTAVLHAVTGWVQDALDQSHREDRTVLVAEQNGSVVGFVSASHIKHWSGASDGYIGELVVSPEAEGAGVGSALIQAAVEWCRSRGLKRVRVDTGVANTRARSLYQKLGFEEEGITLSIATQ